MELIKFIENNENQFVFLDKNQKIVELPSKYMLEIGTYSIRYSDKTVMHYSRVILYFMNFLEKKYSIAVDSVLATMDGIVISEYLKYLDLKGLSPATIRNREAIIREFLRWLTTESAGKVRKNDGYASSRYKSPNLSKKIPKYLTLNEIVNFIKLLKDENQRCLIHFLFDSGVRVSEIVRIKKSDIPDIRSFSEESVYFDINILGSKGGGGNIKERKTFISKAMILRINRLHKQNPVYRKAIRKFGDEMPCFVNAKGERLTEGAIRSLLYAAAKRNNLKPSKYSSHKFRHSFAVSILMSEFDQEFLNKLVILRDILGHNDIKTTEIYSHIPPAAIKNLQLQNKKFNIINRFEEAQFIFEETYLPMRNHTEKRGR